MAAEVQPLPLLLPAAGPVLQTVDQAYWKTFKNQLLLPSPHNAGVTSITIPDFNPHGAQADTFAVTSGGRVQTYSVRTRKLVKTISRFGVDDTARSGVLRRDGRILLAGGDSGVVQAFDTGSRAILRQWRGKEAHRLPVHTVRWSPHVLTDLVSCSDDRTVRAWDLTEDMAKWTGVGHEDYVRSGAYLPGQSGNLIISGSYDQSVRLWDTRMNGSNAALTFKFAAPIEDVLTINSASFAAAAGNEVSVINLMAGKAEHIIRSHQKTVTVLSTAQNATRILTAGLDGHVKVHNTASWEIVGASKYPAPILSLAVVPAPPGQEVDRDDRHLVVGLQNGLLSIRTRLAGAEKARVREREKKMQAIVAGEGDEYDRKQRKKDFRQGIRARDRGKDFQGESADIVITGNERSRYKKLKPWQESLRKGEYSQALVQTLPRESGQYDKTDLLTLLTALRHRSALRAALADLPESSLNSFLHFAIRYIANPRHVQLFYDVVLLVLDLYSHRLNDWQDDDGDGREIHRLIQKLRIRIKQECDWADYANRMLGMLSMLETG